MSEVQRICPQCSEPGPLTARYCPHCGADSQAALPVPSSTLPAVLTKAALPLLAGAASLVLRAGWKLWQSRLAAELQLAIEAKRRIQQYKGRQWKAEFMRLMYPACKAANAKGFGDLVRRLTKSPWGNTAWKADSQLRRLVEELTN